MIGGDVRAIGWRGAWPAVAALVCGQSGHLLVYQLRFGDRAIEAQSTGGHAYFPALMSCVLTLAGLAAVVSLGVIGAARAAAGRRSGRSIVRPSVIDLLAVLFTLQLGMFGVQEAVEGALSGGGLEPVVLVYGVACQLPMALVGAVALSLFLARFHEAVERLRDLTHRPWPWLWPAARPRLRAAVAPRLAPQHLLACPASRGPPSRPA